MALTSSVDFLKALREKDYQTCRNIAKINPMAVRGREAVQMSLSAADIAVRFNDMDMLRFLEEFTHIDFDMKDNAGDTPLIYAILKK